MVISAAPRGQSGGEESGRRLRSARRPAGKRRDGDGQDMPLLDPAVLVEMGQTLGRPDLATNFARDYVALWDQRERRLTASIAGEDHDAALDAAISLKVTSAMIGALRLAHLAQALESAVRADDLSRGSAVLALISSYGQATVGELQVQHLQRRR